ncbi:hypothetical protein HKX48_009394 [Thoreauomyces humboldtii]|nr:hypothetical protein HKX48_009394 [Thoreauomyces humboldtii]
MPTITDQEAHVFIEKLAMGAFASQLDSAEASSKSKVGWAWEHPLSSIKQGSWREPSRTNAVVTGQERLEIETIHVLDTPDHSNGWSQNSAANGNEEDWRLQHAMRQVRDAEGVTDSSEPIKRAQPAYWPGQSVTRSGVVFRPKVLPPPSLPGTSNKNVKKKKAKAIQFVSGLLHKTKAMKNSFKKTSQTHRPSTQAQQPTCERRGCNTTFSMDVKEDKRYCKPHRRQLKLIQAEVATAIQKHSNLDFEYWTWLEAEFSKTSADLPAAGPSALMALARYATPPPASEPPHTQTCRPSVPALDLASTSVSARDEPALGPRRRIAPTPVDATAIASTSRQQQQQQPPLPQTVNPLALHSLEYVVVEDETGRASLAPRPFDPRSHGPTATRTVNGLPSPPLQARHQHTQQFPPAAQPTSTVAVRNVEQQQRQVCSVPIDISVNPIVGHQQEQGVQRIDLEVTFNVKTAPSTPRQAVQSQSSSPPRLQLQPHEPPQNLAARLRKAKEETVVAAVPSVRKTAQVQYLLVENEDGEFVEVEVPV